MPKVFKLRKFLYGIDHANMAEEWYYVRLMSFRRSKRSLIKKGDAHGNERRICQVSRKTADRAR